MGTTSQKFITNNNGSFQEVASINTSVGSADHDKVIATNASGIVDPTLLNATTTSAGAASAGKLAQLNSNGILDATLVNSTQTSAGAADAGKVVALTSTGQIALSMMPTGIMPEVAVMTASENLSTGDLVNVWSNAGVFSVRKADATTAGKEAHGFVLDVITSGATGNVYFEGSNNQLTGLSAGKQFLSTVAGKTQATAPIGSGNVVQVVGFATSPTSMSFQSEPAVILA